MPGDRTKTPPETLPPKAVVSRMSLYLRELQQLVASGRETISSTQLGARLGFTDAQVRKDLAYFGQFGYPGLGYRVRELVDAIRRILGTDQDWPAAIVGMGNLGQALIGYKGFAAQNFRVVAAFDNDPAKVGREIEGISVYDFAELPEVVAAAEIRLGIVAVPARAAQQVADQLVAAGVQGILNFAPVNLTVETEIGLVSVDLATQLEQLSFTIVNRRPAEPN